MTNDEINQALENCREQLMEHIATKVMSPILDLADYGGPNYWDVATKAADDVLQRIRVAFLVGTIKSKPDAP